LRVFNRSTPVPLLCAVVLLSLLALRLTSLVHPAGADQSLYAYVGQRINAGGVPYLDAWDQKPPAVHFIYASLWRVWPDGAIVAAADLAAAGFIAALLVVLGRRTFGAAPGVAAAAVFLLLGNPAIQRLSGVRVRAQCETFIALAVTAAIVLAIRRDRRTLPLALAGVFLGLAFWLKYNAAVYLLPVFWAMLASRDAGAGAWDLGKRILTPLLPVGAGFLLVSLVFLAYFASHGALTDLWLATVTYNLQYSGETYRGLGDVAEYLTFPLERARLELLWYLGGLGVILLLLRHRSHPFTWALAAWLAAACVAIALNGARDLPQYFIQAHPALAFAAGAGLWSALRHGHAATRSVGVLLLVVGAWRVGTEPVAVRLGGLPEVVRNARFDLAYLTGRVDRATYLARFQQQEEAKYVPLSAEALTELVRRTTAEGDSILIFGFAASVYVEAPRVSASRFFWSRPVAVEFEQGRPGYGSAGLLRDLQRTSPAVVALQKQWEDPTPHDFWMNHPPLRTWLESGYTLEEDTPHFAIWRRRG
jgi:hypothetical protein